MRKLLISIMLVISLSSVLITTDGCKSTTAQTQVYQTLYTVSQVVNSTYAFYNDMLVSGKVPIASTTTIVPLYRTYQIAFNTAIVMARGNTNAVAPADVISKAATLTTAINALTTK